MKLKCKRDIQLDGDIVKRGSVVDVSRERWEKDARVRASFEALEGTEKREEEGTEKKETREEGTGKREEEGTGKREEGREEKKIVAGLTREQTILTLRERGVMVPANISDERLAMRYLESFEN